MNKRFLGTLHILSALSLFYTGLAGAANVAYVATSCDTIVTGAVTSRTESANNVSFDVAVQRVLKGNAISGPIHVFHLGHGTLGAYMTARRY